MKKVLKYILVALVAIIFLGTFIFLFVNSKPKEVAYHELTAERTDIQRTAVVTGKIVPRNEVNIKPQINGIITELYKEAGQKVERGEVIAKLTVIPDMNSLSSAQSRVRLAEINLKQAQTNFDREQALYASRGMRFRWAAVPDTAGLQPTKTLFVIVTFSESPPSSHSYSGPR